MSNRHYWSKSHREQVLKLLAALGIDPDGVIGITLHLRVNEVSRVVIERQIMDGHLEVFSQILKGYGEENPFAEEDEPPQVSASDQAVQKASLDP